MSGINTKEELCWYVVWKLDVRRVMPSCRYAMDRVDQPLLLQSNGSTAWIFRAFTWSPVYEDNLKMTVETRACH